MSAPKGNRNRTTHGVHGYLAIGSLPKGASYIRRSLGQFRLALENSVQDKEGEICLYNAALIQSSVRHEARAQLLTRWLRKPGKDSDAKQPGLSFTERLAVLREIGSATDARDKCLQRLGLDQRQQTDIWSVLEASDEPSETSADSPAHGSGAFTSEDVTGRGEGSAPAIPVSSTKPGPAAGAGVD